MPVQSLSFMPGGIVQDHYIPCTFRFDKRICFIQKSLEHLRENVCRLNGEKLSGAGADHADDVHPDMVAIFCASRFLALAIPTPPWPGIAFKAGLIRKPNVRVRLFMKLFELSAKYRSLLFVLTVGPRLRNFQGKALAVKEPYNRFVAAFDFIGLSNVSVKCASRPKFPVSLLGLIDELGEFVGAFSLDLSGAPWPLAHNQAINASLIECVYPVAKAPLSDKQCGADLLPGYAGGQHLYGGAA
jgi:hypothetical protein